MTLPTVTFGGVAATVVSATKTEVVCMAPAHVAGAVDVVMTNSQGAQTTLSSAFTYAGLNFDAFLDFDAVDNPAGASPWSYGYAPSSSWTLTLFGFVQTILSGDIVEWRNGGAGGYPIVAKNISGDDVTSGSGVLYPGADYLVLHPGGSGQRAVVRWTCPQAGTYEIVAHFKKADPSSSTQVYVVNNGTSLWSASIGSAPAEQTFVAVCAEGDTFDFAVDPSGGYSFDNTCMRAAITLQSV